MRGKKRPDFCLKPLAFVPMRGYFSIRVYDDVRQFTIYRVIDRVPSVYGDIIVARPVTGRRSKSGNLYFFDSRKQVLHHLNHVPNP